MEGTIERCQSPHQIAWVTAGDLARASHVSDTEIRKEGGAAVGLLDGFLEKSHRFVIAATEEAEEGCIREGLGTC